MTPAPDVRAALEVKRRRYRVSQWLDTSNMQADELPILYGIQIYLDGRGWTHVAEGGKALIYKTAVEAVRKIDEIKSRPADAAREALGEGK